MQTDIVCEKHIRDSMMQRGRERQMVYLRIHILVAYIYLYDSAFIRQVCMCLYAMFQGHD